MRQPTHADAELLLRLYEVRREPELRRARQWFLTEFQPALYDHDPRYVHPTQEELAACGMEIDQVGQKSAHLAEIIGRPVHLFMFVKVRTNWSDDPARYRELGLDFPRD